MKNTETIDNLFSQFQTKAVCLRIKKNYPELYHQINSLVARDFKTKLYMYYHEYENVPHCKECGEKEVVLISYYVGFREFCCGSCSTKNMSKKYLVDYNSKHKTSYTNIRQIPKIKEKAEKTLISKFGTLMPVNDCPEIREKAEKTSMKKYGVTSAAHAPEVRAKAQETMRNRSSVERDETNIKYKSTVMHRFGVENPMQNTEIFEKAKQTRIKKYGVEYCLQNSDILNKQTVTRKKTFLEKYNTSNIFEIDGVREKYKDTCIKNFGEAHPMKNKEFQQKNYSKAKKTLISKHGVNNPTHVQGAADKSIQTCLKKYGKEFYSQTDEFKTKRKNSMIEKYGVEYSLLIPGNLEKIQSKQYSTKEYIWKTGEVSMVQGYEPIVLNELEENGYKFEDVKTRMADKPLIKYVFENEEKNYIPDFFIPSENLIIEVKSDYTLNKEWDKNQAKFKAVKDAGYDFRLEVR